MTDAVLNVRLEGARKPVTTVPPAVGFLVLLGVATAVPWLTLPWLARNAAQGGMTAQTKTLLVFLGSGVHVAASYALYFDNDLRPVMRAHRLRYFVAPVAVVIVSAVLFAWSGARLSASLLTFYFVWQTHHYTRQNIGVFAFSTKALHTLPATTLERAAITTSGFAGVIGMITLIAPFERTPIARPAMYAHNIASLVFVGALVLLVLCIPRALEAGNPMRFVFLVAGVAFYLPTFIYRDPFSAVSSYAIAHGCQYLVFMAYIAAHRRESIGRRFVLPTAGLALFGGLVLWRMQHATGVGRPWAALNGFYLGLVMVHFVLDAGVWRLSEPAQRKYMAERFGFLAG